MLTCIFINLQQSICRWNIHVWLVWLNVVSIASTDRLSVVTERETLENNRKEFLQNFRSIFESLLTQSLDKGFQLLKFPCEEGKSKLFPFFHMLEWRIMAKDWKLTTEENKKREKLLLYMPSSVHLSKKKRLFRQQMRLEAQRVKTSGWKGWKVLMGKQKETFVIVLQLKMYSKVSKTWWRVWAIKVLRRKSLEKSFADQFILIFSLCVVCVTNSCFLLLWIEMSVEGETGQQLWRFWPLLVFHLFKMQCRYA